MSRDLPFLTIDSSEQAHNTLCPKVILSCTNEGCEVQTTRASMPKHLSTCDHAIVECGWNICTHRVSTSRTRMDDGIV